MREGGETAAIFDDTLGRLGTDGEERVAAELHLEIARGQRKVRAAAGMVLALLEDAAVVEPDADVADELPRVVDRGIELVADPPGDGEDAGVAGGLVGEIGEP